MSWVFSGIINGVVNEDLRARPPPGARGEPPAVPGELKVGCSFTKKGLTGVHWPLVGVLWSKQARKVTKTAAQRPNRGMRRAPQTLHYCSSHKGFGVINEDFEFLQLMSWGHYCF